MRGLILVKVQDCESWELGSNPSHPIGGPMQRNHLFEEFKLLSELGRQVLLCRCKICKAIKLSIIEYGKREIDTDDTYLRGSKYCE